MEIKQDDQTLVAEIEQIFEKLAGLAIVPKGRLKATEVHIAQICLLMMEDDYENAKQAKIHHLVRNLFYEKSFRLLIAVDELNKKFQLCVKDEESGIKFIFKSSDVEDSLDDFFKNTDEDDIMEFALLGVNANRQLIYDKLIPNNILGFLYGYSVIKV